MLGPWLGSWIVGCAGTGDELRPSPAEEIDGSGAVGVEVLGGAGDAPYRIQVRTLNVYGASVPAEDATVTLDGTPYQIGFDALGYGGISVSDPGDHVASVDGGAPVTAHVFRSPWAGVGGASAFPAPVAEIDEVFGVTDGLVARAGAELWFVGDTTPAHRVLLADSDLLGARAANVDVDGRIDLVAWTATEVFVLRGHTGGGFGWGTAFRATGLTVAAADVGDLTGDNLPDLAIAWIQADGRGVLDVWEAVGVFRFEAAEPRNILGNPRSLVVNDANGDGVAQVTVLHDDGTWSRYLRGAEKQYIPVGPSLPQALFAAPGSTLHPCGDANGDGADEVVIASPWDPEVDRTVDFVDIATEPLECEQAVPGAQCLTEFVQLDGLVGGEAACGDADSDAIVELWAWDRVDGLRVYQHDPFTADFRSVAVDHPFPDGRFALSDRDDDGVSDPIVADATTWSQWYGAPATDAEGIWSIRPELVWRVREEVFGPYARADIDGDDTTLEWATATSNPSGTYFRLVQYTPLGDGSPIVGDVRLDTTGTVIDDLAVCGTTAYVVLAGQVIRVSLVDPLDPVVVNATGTDVRRVACGTGPNGSAVVTVTAAGLVELRNIGLAKIADVPGTAGDAALADVGGGPEVVTCPTAGCTVVAWRYGAGAGVVRSDGDTLVLSEDGAADVTLGGSGVPVVADLDGDGREDLAAWDGERRRLTVFRSSGGAVPPPAFVLLQGEYRDVQFADGDLDGSLDLFATNPSDQLVHTLLTLPPEPTGTTP